MSRRFSGRVRPWSVAGIAAAAELCVRPRGRRSPEPGGRVGSGGGWRRPYRRPPNGSSIGHGSRPHASCGAQGSTSPGRTGRCSGPPCSRRFIADQWPWSVAGGAAAAELLVRPRGREAPSRGDRSTPEAVVGGPRGPPSGFPIGNGGRSHAGRRATGSPGPGRTGRCSGPPCPWRFPGRRRSWVVAGIAAAAERGVRH
jgi:hypothetical protein